MAIPTRVRMRLSGTPLARIYAASHRLLYRWSGGRLGQRIGVAAGEEAPPVLLLTTRGRRSGRLRTTPLIYLWEGRELLLVAANAAHPRDPAWSLNLRAEPRAEVRIGARRFEARARLLEDAGERAAAWRRYARLYPPIDEYAAGSSRSFPVVALVRADGGEWPAPAA
jgi:deazaflavin-dependent oxidoreductase (nitroreductase family)